MVLGMSTSVFAFSDSNEPNYDDTANELHQTNENSELALPLELEELEEKFKQMSNAELNSYISNVVNAAQTNGVSSGATVAAMKAAWLAAAQVAINKGYKCAGTLVKYSVLGSTYRETDGIFKAKIKGSAPYKAWTKKPSMNYKNITFTSSTPDLYYSLHTASIKVLTANSSTGIIRVYDLYDFDIKFMGSLFSTLVNDWAALCMYTGVLEKVEVYIDFHG